MSNNNEIRYEIAEFNTNTTDWNFKENYNILDELVGANLSRNISNQQLKKFYPHIAVEDYEENEDWHIGFARGKYLALEAARNWIAFYLDKHQDEIETVISSAGDRPYLDVEFNEVDDITDAYSALK